MKVKDIERTANVAWSPKDQHPIYLAAGTAAQQLDASFNTNAAIELYSLNLTEPDPEMQLVSSIPSAHRFHRIIWGSQGQDGTHGTIVGGCDGGLLQIYSASKLLKGEEALIDKQEKHTGPVNALDFNTFQQNLFATGAGNSEIFIWDLHNTTTPMSPGAKSQPLEDVLSVSWNKQVQHILASTFPSKCVIWDLRKNEPIIKLTDTVSRIRWKVVAWHPEVATQLCLASEEDQSPIIQLWDLRFATSPLKTLENHQRGVLSVSWCSADSDLLVSCGKDNRILVWNPNSNQQNGEILSELGKTNQWSFDVVWCPRNPALIASPNFDGHVGVYSLMGGKTQQIQTTNKIADSFPGMDGYVQAPVSQTTPAVSTDLSRPPKWLKRPVGASFGFGGKLIIFENDKAAVVQSLQNAQPGQTAPTIHRTVQVSQVITEPVLVQKSSELEKALEYGNFTEYCMNKSEESSDQHKKYIWHFLKANFDNNPRAQLLNLLGYSIEDINNKLSQHIGDELSNDVDGLTDELSNNRLEDFAEADPFSSITKQEEKKPEEPFIIKTGDDTEGLITQALLLNNVEAAVALCLKAKRFADALIIATTGGADLLARTQHAYLEQSEGYVSSLISAAVSEDWGSIINNCDVDSWKEALAAALTHASDSDLPLLCEQLGNRLEDYSNNNSKLTQDAQLCYICAGSFDKLVSSWSNNAMTSTEKLQELIELVMFLQKAIERQGRQIQISESLANLLSYYASLLASQGDLKTAVAYLGSTQNEKVSKLRDRIHVALGQKPSYVQDMRQTQGRRGSQRHSFTNNFSHTNPFSTQNQYGSVPSQPAAPAPPPQFNPGQFNTGLPNQTVNSQPWQPQPVTSFSQPPKPFSPAPQPLPPSQPPRPTSVGSSQGGTSGLPSRKYVLDPSVTSHPYGVQARNPYPPDISSYQTNSFSTSYVPPPVNSASSNSVGPAQTGFNQGSFNPPPLVPNPTFNPTSLPAGNAAAAYSGAPPVDAAYPAFNTFSNAPSGWNDPPPLSKSLKSQQKSDVQSSDPITHPIFGTAPVDQSLPPNGYADNFAPPPAQQYAQPAPPYNNNNVNTPMHTQNPPNVYQPQAAIVPQNYAQGFNMANFNQNAIGRATPQQASGGNVTSRAETPQQVEKAPIPDEHVHMKTVFDELKDRCSCAASNPQTKRKLEDVGRKLESLYDLLREQKLIPTTLSSLHQMVHLVQNGDYTGGLALHTQLVSGPDFAQIASFMPGLKVLLQCALQLQVYIR